MSYIRIEKPRPHTSVIVMDRPERMNSMAFEQVVPLHDAIAEVAQDNDTWCVILTGVGRGFCSGADTQESEPPPNIAGLTLTRIATRAMSILADLVPAMRRMPQPVIAAVNGAAVGVGVTMILPCDIRIAAERAKLGLTFTKLGILPGLGSTHLLPRLVGLGRAQELVLTARVIEAPEAAAIGLVNRVVPGDALLATAREVAAQSIACDPDALAVAKRALHAGSMLDMAGAMQNERAANAELRELKAKRSR